MTDRIRVLCVIKGLGLGGAERLLVSLAQTADSDHFDYQVLYLLPWKDALVADLVAEGVPVACLEGGREWNLGWARRLRRRLILDPVDVVHLHSPYVAGITRLLVRTLPRRLRPRLVTTEHIPWTAHKLATRTLNLATFPLDAAHLAVSAPVRDSIPAVHRGHVETLVHGVVLDKVRRERAFRQSMRAELGIAADQVLVGTIANFLPQKAYPNLLEAATTVARSGSPVRFVAVGQGPAEAEVRALHAELALEATFALLGGRTDALRVLSACDMFVLASHYEGYPVALMEALALGLPVVATRVGGVPDAVRDGIEGLLVPPGRADLLAAAILTLAGDPERRATMADHAYARGAEFDISRAVRRTEAIYRELVESATGAGRSKPAE